MKREIKIGKDGLPETITLPRAKQFIAGMFWDHDRPDCGCLLGHAYYAWGCHLTGMSVAGSTSIAVDFAMDVLKELGAKDVSITVVWHHYDKLYWEAQNSANLVYFVRCVAHAWRVVADRWGWDVRASEPEWEP